MDVWVWFLVFGVSAIWAGMIGAVAYAVARR